MAVQPTSASIPGFAVRGAASQSANLMEIQSSAGTILSRFSSSGQLVSDQQTYIGSGATSIANTRFNVATGSGSVVGQAIRGASGQTANLLEFQESNAGVPSAVTAFGGFRIRNFGATVADTSLAVFAGYATEVPVRVRGAVSQSVNLQEWQDSNGFAVGLINAFGAAAFGTNSVLARLTVSTGSTGTVGGLIRAVASQTADLLQLQNSAGTNQFRVDPAGMTITNSLGVSGSPSGISYAYFTTPSASAKPVVIRGAASQSANLLEVQNSAGSVLAFVCNDGVVRAPFLSTSTNYLFVGEQNSGGYIAMTKQTAAISNIGADRAGIYFRDGTNAGTLKLVVRAGATGAETTILDNIPT
jgi:hypothetical protein